MTRIISLLLLFALVFAITACGSEKTENPKDTTSTAEAETTTTDEGAITTYLEPLNPAIGKLDYGGDTFTVLSYVFDGTQEIYAEELTNELLNDAIYNRNIAVSEMLNIEIEEYCPGKYEISNSLRMAISSGDDTYDAVSDPVSEAAPLMLDGMFYNLLDNGIDTYLDPSKPWWSQKWLEQATTGDRLYCITGSLALSLKKLLFVTYYNKTFGEAHGIENLYDVVNEGRWTADYENELVKKLYVDLNGNSEHDAEDSYGLLINNYDCTDQFWSAFDLHLFEKDSDNWFVLSDDQEKLSNGLDKAYALVQENTGTYQFPGIGFEGAANMFSNGQSLLCAIHLRWAETEYFRNMQDDYGIIPEPKFDENQKKYYTYAHDQYSVFMVPISAPKPEMSGAVLEALCYESYKSVEPTYLDIVLKGRYANDLETRKMIDTIIDGFTVDPSWIYGRNVGEPAAFLIRVQIMNADKSAFGSRYTRYARVLPYALKELRQTMEGFDY